MHPDPTPVPPSTAATAPTELSVLLVEDHALVLAALRALIAATPGLAVVAEARTAGAAAEAARRHQPDVVLVDGRTLAGAGGDAVGGIREGAPGACVLLLADAATLRDGVPGDVHGCLREDAGPDQLREAIVALLGPRCANCPLLAACPLPRLVAALSRRERQVAIRVAAGMSSKQIAAALGIGMRTVNTYREGLARKVGASSAAVLTRFVLSAGLTEA